MNSERKSAPVSPVSGVTGMICDARAGIIVLDARRKVRALNPEAERLVGVASSEVLNRDIKNLPAAVRRLADRVHASGRPIEGRQISLSTPAGKVWIRVTTVSLQSGKARSGVVLVLNDLAVAQVFEQKLSRFDRLGSIATLSASVTHEVKNALVSVKTFIDLLLDKNQDAELADVVRHEMNRINALVGQTLKFAGPARPALSPMGVHSVLEHSLRMVQPQIHSKVISLSRSFQAKPDVVLADEYQMEQVFVNLFLNAIEAMSSSGSLSVSTEVVSPPAAGRSAREAVPHIRVTVADTGMGIAPENMQRLFEPFFTTKTNGTGLGLAIARRIVEEHKGVIEVQTEYNKGTTFKVLLPAHTP